jgi:hypothetical protein
MKSRVSYERIMIFLKSAEINKNEMKKFDYPQKNDDSPVISYLETTIFLWPIQKEEKKI